MHTDAIVSLNDVSFTYESASAPAVSHSDFRILPGEFVAILGHNGSGKSTLAKLINALYLPSEGNVVVCGYDTKDQNLGVPTEEMIPRIESALSVVRMSKYADASPHTLSGGQKQRVAIAGILAMEPSVIIADEATAMLDPSGRNEVLDTIRMLNKSKNITVVWITHFMEEAAQADRVMVMSDGEIKLSGTPAEVFDRVQDMKEMHLDVPHMTSLAAQLRQEGMPLRPGILTVDDLAEEVEKALCQSKSVT